MLKKITALLLALLLLIPMAASCAKDEDETPEGMKSATLPGEPFCLYVPESWSLNTAGGISGACYNSAQKILVSARYYTPNDPEMTLNQYVDLCSATYATTLRDYQVTAREPALLGKENAQRLVYTMTDNGTAMTCFQITTLYEGSFVSLHGYCASELYEARSEDYKAMIDEFVLTAPSNPQGEPLTDKNTPDGFQIASGKDLEYRLYVPTTWICDAESGASEAYYPESGRSNVAVATYSPSESISVGDYFLSCEKEYAEKLPAYERLSEKSRTLAGRTAHTYTYRTTVDGRSFIIMQTLCAYNQNIYSVTYTALEENFELHKADAEAILNAFTFR